MFYLHDAVPVMYVHRRQSIEANLDDISREGSMPNAMTTDPHGHCAGLSLSRSGRGCSQIAYRHADVHAVSGLSLMLMLHPNTDFRLLCRVGFSALFEDQLLSILPEFVRVITNRISQ